MAGKSDIKDGSKGAIGGSPWLMYLLVIFGGLAAGVGIYFLTRNKSMASLPKNDSGPVNPYNPKSGTLQNQNPWNRSYNRKNTSSEGLVVSNNKGWKNATGLNDVCVIETKKGKGPGSSKRIWVTTGDETAKPILDVFGVNTAPAAKTGKQNNQYGNTSGLPAQVFEEMKGGNGGTKKTAGWKNCGGGCNGSCGA